MRTPYSVTATLSPETGLWVVTDSEGTVSKWPFESVAECLEHIREWHAPSLVREVSRTETQAVFTVVDAEFFTLPGLAGRDFLGYATGETWNGYACPRFDPEEAAEIVAALRADGHDEFAVPAPDADGLCSFPGFCWSPAE